MTHQIVPVSSTREYLNKLWAGAPEDVVQVRGSMQYGDELKYITVRFDPKEFPNSIELIMLTDVQYGHLACQVSRVIEFRDWVLAKPNRFVFFGGDMVDAATAISIASPYENTVEPQGQVYRFCEMMMPLRHRVLGFVGGNHERRSAKTFGDLGHMIATLLKIPYSAGRQFVDIHYGEHDAFRVDLWHGGTGSRTKGAKAQMLHRFMAQGVGQLYLVGHLHDVVVLFDWRQVRKGKRIFLEKFAGAMSSSFLDYWNTYAETMGLAPSDTMMARCILEPNGKWELTFR